MSQNTVYTDAQLQADLQTTIQARGSLETWIESKAHRNLGYQEYRQKVAQDAQQVLISIQGKLAGMFSYITSGEGEKTAKDHKKTLSSLERTKGSGLELEKVVSEMTPAIEAMAALQELDELANAYLNSPVETAQQSPEQMLKSLDENLKIIAETSPYIKVNWLYKKIESHKKYFESMQTVYAFLKMNLTKQAINSNAASIKDRFSREYLLTRAQMLEKASEILTDKPIFAELQEAVQALGYKIEVAIEVEPEYVEKPAALKGKKLKIVKNNGNGAKQ